MNLSKSTMENASSWFATSFGNSGKWTSPWLKRSLIRGPSWWFRRSQRNSFQNKNRENILLVFSTEGRKNGPRMTYVQSSSVLTETRKPSFKKTDLIKVIQLRDHAGFSLGTVSNCTPHTLCCCLGQDPPWEAPVSLTAPVMLLGQDWQGNGQSQCFHKTHQVLLTSPLKNRLRCPRLEANFPPAWTQLLPVLRPLSALSQITLSCFLPHSTGCSRKRTAEPGQLPVDRAVPEIREGDRGQIP